MSKLIQFFQTRQQLYINIHENNFSLDQGCQIVYFYIKDPNWDAALREIRQPDLDSARTNFLNKDNFQTKQI
jgi:hypothetical protein